MANRGHIFNEWILKPEKEVRKKHYYYGLMVMWEKLEQAPTLKSPKKIQNKMRYQFLDTFYELDVGCSLLEKGFEVNFEKILA